MPLYEYRCDKCNETFEVIQKFSDEPLTVHEKCGGAVHRLLSAPALQFKGSGWYVNDYAKGSGSPQANANGGSGDSSGKSDSGGKTESGGKSDSGSKSESGGKSDSGSKSDTSSSTPSTTSSNTGSTSSSSSDKK